MRRLLIIQVIIIGLLTLTVLLLVGAAAAKACLFGGIIALLSTGLMILHERRATRRAGDDARLIVRHLYLCAAERMLLVGVLFAMGLIALNLMPLYLIAGFIAGQVAAFLNGISH
jgi:hypothetical protein